jgi:hypothetical protein
MNRDIVNAVGFEGFAALAESGRCPFCRRDMKGHSFRDTLSFREFQISGLCQECQDEMFTTE